MTTEKILSTLKSQSVVLGEFFADDFPSPKIGIPILEQPESGLSVSKIRIMWDKEGFCAADIAALPKPSGAISKMYHKLAVDFLDHVKSELRQAGALKVIAKDAGDIFGKWEMDESGESRFLYRVKSTIHFTR